MVSKIVERILKKYLAPYIDGISRDGLSILKGDLSLQNLKIKAEAFDFLKPYGILLKSGKVARLHLQIPWRQLTQGKITIELETVSAAVARIQGDIPDDARILADNWHRKAAMIEKKLQELQELAESAGSEEAGAGYVGRFMHRLAQNIQVSVGGGIMLQGFDTKQTLSGGLLLSGLRVSSVGDASPDPKVVSLQKRVEVTDIAAYVTVDDGAPRYMLEPTRLVLSVDHCASNLVAKLEVLDRGSDKKGCRLAVSRTALYRLAVTFREMGAWQQHTQEVISRHCGHVRKDQSALEGETYQQYTQLYRRKVMGKEGLSREDEDTLQAIEEAVMSRHLARWRMEVNQALKTKKTEERRGWRFLGRGGQKNGLVQSQEEWDELQKQIREDQAHLADLDRPRTIAVSILVQSISAQLYDDSGSKPEGGSELQRAEERLGYGELVRSLDDLDLGSVIKHDLRIKIEQPRTSVKITPKVVADHERMEWSFGVCFGKMELWCDQDAVLRYISPDTQQLSSRLEPDQFKDIAICSRVQDDGRELISANVNLPPTQLSASPQFLAVVVGLVSMELPEPPVFGSASPSSKSSNEKRDDDFNFWNEWGDEFAQWKQDVVIETAGKQAERVQESALVFLIDVAVAAPQITVAVSDSRRIHVDLGRICLKSDGVMKADNFRAALELSNTQVTCITGGGPRAVELRYPLLEPISLTVNIAGLKKEDPKRVSQGPAVSVPLDVELAVQLRQVKFAVYPQAVHVLLQAPQAFLPALNLQGSAAQPSRQEGQIKPVVADNAREEQQQQAETEAGGSSLLSKYSVHATASIKLISLGVFDLDSAQVARVDLAELCSEASLRPDGDMAGGVSMQYFLVEVKDQPLVQLRDLGSTTNPGREALGVKVRKQAQPPITIAVHVCPMTIEWRKECVKALIAAAGTCVPAKQKSAQVSENELAEALVNQISEAIEVKAKERRATLLNQPRRSLTLPKAVADDHPSREVAKKGLSASGELPRLQSEIAEEGTAPTPPAIAVDAKFGGLLIKLHREEHEKLQVLPVWRATSGRALVEFHADDVGVSLERWANGEARCRATLESFSLLYDGQCVVAPWNSSASVFESEVRLFLPVDAGGPLHSVCFRGLLRKVSLVLFLKNIDSMVDYGSSNIAGALLKEAAEEAKGAMEKPKAAESVALWHFYVESPVLHLGRDEAVLKNSPRWDGSLEWELDPPQLQSQEAGPDAEAEGGADHPTPMVKEWHQYLTFMPGSITARNSFEADGSDSPPFLCSVSFTQTNFDAKDLVGSASGSILKIDNWDVMVRVDSKTHLQPMHLSIGLLFHPITCSLSPEKLELLLSVSQENFAYRGYFPKPVAAAPTASVQTTTVQGSEKPDSVTLSANVRVEFEGLALNLSRPSLISQNEGELAYEPLLGLVIREMRIAVDVTGYSGSTPMALQLGVFLNSASADDLRPPEVRACSVPTELLGLSADSGFAREGKADKWQFVLDRVQGQEHYTPENYALLVLCKLTSASSASVRVELRRPRIFLLLRLVTDTVSAMSAGAAGSSMVCLPPPPPPEVPPSIEKLAVSALIQEASLTMYTSYERASAPLMQGFVTLATEVAVHMPIVTFQDATLSDLRITRTEIGENETSFGTFSVSRRSRASTVQIVTLPSLKTAGEFKGGQRPEMELQVHALPASIRLTTGDVPYLVAAVSGLGGDGRVVEKTVVEGNSSSDGLREPGLEPHGACAGVLRLLAQGLVGSADLQSLWLTGNFGDGGKSFAVPWGRPLLVHVPLLQGRGGSHKTVCEGPILQLTLHGAAAGGGSRSLGSLVLPVELCAGKGLDGALLLRGSGVAEPAVWGRSLPELQLEARYEPSSSEDSVAMGILALSAAAESFEDFVRPMDSLESFLQESVPKFEHHARRRRTLPRRSHLLVRPVGPAAARTSAKAPFSLALRVACDGLEASFLDDCQANVLPVLRFNLHPGCTSPGPPAASAQAQAQAEQAETLKVDLNPWRAKGQQIGVSVHVVNCAIGVSYLNARAGCWEPFLEPWAIDFFFSKFEGFERDRLPAFASSKPLFNAKYPAAMEITLMSFGPLNVNVTPQLCSLASFLLSNKDAYMRRVESPAAAVDSAAGVARYRLLNLASAPLCLAVVKPGASGEAEEAVDWRVFEPCSYEASLDPLLGNHSAEEWRLMADETVTCLVGLQPPGHEAPSARAWPAHVRMVLSSTCSGLIPPLGAGGVGGNVPGVHAACEVLLPHPSHHLMLVSSRLRVFNHTSQPLEIRFSSHGPSDPPTGAQVPEAAPMHVLPNRLAYPPEIVAVLGPDMSSEDEAMASMAPMRKRSATSTFAAELGPVPDVPDAQRLPPQHFCSAPLWADSVDAVVELRAVGASQWSSPVPLVCGEPVGSAVLLPSADGAPLRFYSYLSHSCLAPDASSSASVTAVHLCAPLQLLNATPVRLAFSFVEQNASANARPLSMEVAAFSACGPPATLDPTLPFSLSLTLADERVNVTSPEEALPMPNIFDSSLPSEEVVEVPLTRTSAGCPPALGITVSRGLAVRASCGRWLVDRTGLGLRALCVGSSESASPDTRPLPQVDGHLTLLEHSPATTATKASSRSSKSISEYRKYQSELKFYLAVPSGDGRWAALAPVKLPDEDSGYVLAALVQAQHKTSNSTDPDAYPLHVCLQTEAVSNRLTFGAPSQLISVLPQVVIYNQLDDSLTVCAAGDTSTEVCIRANQSGSFLRWKSEASASSGKSPLSLQFRPVGLSSTSHWSAPISLAVGEASGPIAMALHPLTMPVARPRNLVVDMFTVELAERGGVVCFTVSRGSRCELQNCSCLVETVTVRPMGPQGEKEEWPPRPLKEFSAGCCETVEFAWPTAGTESQLEVVLVWKRVAGGTETRGPAPDVKKPGHAVFQAPDGWQAVVVETGTTGNVCWMRVQDVIWTTTRKKANRLEKGPAPAKLKVVISVAHVGLSLVSPKRDQELLYAELRNVAGLLGQWEDSLCLEFTVTNAQVDNQLDSKECPVVVANRREPFLQCKVVQQLPVSKGVVGLDVLGVRIQALELSINEGFLAEVVQAINDMLRPILSTKEVNLEKIEAWRRAPLSSGFEVPPPVPSQIAINQFTFMGLEMHLWASMRLAKLPAALRGALGLLTIGSDRLSIQGATLELDSEVFDDIRGPAPTVAKMILQRYWANLLISLASLLGRSTLLELPRLPVKWGRRGVEGGMCAIDFLLTRTANVFELVSLDKQYVRQKRPLLGRQIMEVKGLRTGIGAAGQHLAEGVMHVGDIVREPIEGAREGGAKGFAIGVGRGVMGTVVEPVLGAVYGVQSLAHGVYIAAGRDRVAESGHFVDTRRRAPRVMYAAGAIREYVEPEAATAVQQPPT